MLTTAPRLAVLTMAGIAYLAARNIGSTLTCMTRRQLSGVSSTTEPRLPMPTLLSRKSRRPKRSSAAVTMSRALAGSGRSASCADAPRPQLSSPWDEGSAVVTGGGQDGRAIPMTHAPSRSAALAIVQQREEVVLPALRCRLDEARFRHVLRVNHGAHRCGLVDGA